MGKKSSVDIVVSAIDRVAAPIRAINRKIESITQPVRRVRTALRSLAQEAHLPKVGKAFGFVASKLKTAGLGIAGVIGGAALAMRSFIDSADRIGKTADSIGIGIEALQELRFVGDIAGVSVDEMDAALKTATINVGRLKRGSGELAEMLKKGGKSGAELARQLAATGSTEEAVNLLFDALARVTDEARRSDLAAAAFGESGVRMTNIVKNGSVAVAQQREQFRKLGAGMTEQTVRAAERTKDSLTRLFAALKGAGANVGAAFLPVVEGLAEELSGWIAKNREWFREELPGHIKVFIQGIKDSIPEVKRLVGELRPIIELTAKLSRLFLPSEKPTPVRSVISPEDQIQPRGANVGSLAASVRRGDRIQSEFKGKLTIGFDNEGRPRVRSLETNRHDFEVDVYDGPMLGTY